MMDVRSEVEKIFARILDDDKVVFTDSMQARDVSGWNSLNHMRIIVEIEKKFAVNFKPKEVVALNNFGELIGLVTSKLSLSTKSS